MFVVNLWLDPKEVIDSDFQTLVPKRRVKAKATQALAILLFSGPESWAKFAVQTTPILRRLNNELPNVEGPELMWTAVLSAAICNKSPTIESPEANPRAGHQTKRSSSTIYQAVRHCNRDVCMSCVSLIVLS